ncbi:MAG: hypothetical protein LUE92_04820 [Clostridiales bacterium]|nr:hypothetical protein [Clostridiales bacterium]
MLVFLVDAVDQLPADSFRDQLKFLPENLSSKIAAVVSCTEEFPADTFSCVKQVPLFTKEERISVIQANLQAAHRELENRVIEAIAKKEGADHPLYVSLLLQRLLMMDKSDFDEVADRGDGMDAITDLQIDLIREAPQNLCTANVWLIQAASGKLQNQMAAEAIRFLAVSRRGLRESDLEGLAAGCGVSWNSLDFALFINYLRGMFLRREDGTIDFVHKSTREGVLKKIDRQEKHRQVSDWLWELPEWDTLRRSEWLFHCCCAGDGVKLASYAESIREDEAELRFAAGQLMAACRVAGDAWLVSFAASDYRVIGHGFFKLIYQMKEHRGDSLQEESMLERIYRACLISAEKLTNEDVFPEAKKDLSLLHYRLSWISWRRDGKENLKQAVSYMKNSYVITRALCEREDTAENLWYLAEDCKTLGRYYMHMQDKKDPDKTCQETSWRFFEESQKAYADLTARDEAVKYRRGMAELEYYMGLYYDRLDLEEKAEQYYLNSLAYREQLYAESGGLLDEKQIAYTCSSLATLYHWWLAGARETEAMQYYQREALSWEHILTEERSLLLQERAAEAYCDLGRTVQKVKGDEDEKALEEIAAAYERGVELWRIVSRSKPERGKEYADACVRAGRIYRKLGGSANLVKAQQLFRCALPIQRELAQQNNDVESHDALFLTLISFIRTCDDIQHRVELFEEALEEVRYLYHVTKDSYYKQQLKTLKRSGRVLKGLGAFSKFY